MMITALHETLTSTEEMMMKRVESLSTETREREKGQSCLRSADTKAELILLLWNTQIHTSDPC